jgi:signal peptidase II
VENFFHLVYHRNTGGVFGFMAGPPSPLRQAFFVVATLVALLFIAWLIRDWGRESTAALYGLSMVGGGAAGNLIDRVMYGEVIDFIDWHWYDRHWPAFNVADSFITVGTILLLVSAFRRPSVMDDAA